MEIWLFAGSEILQGPSQGVLGLKTSLRFSQAVTKIGYLEFLNINRVIVNVNAVPSHK